MNCYKRGGKDLCAYSKKIKIKIFQHIKLVLMHEISELGDVCSMSPLAQD